MISKHEEPTGIFTLITSPSSVQPVNVVQVLLALGGNHLSKEESSELLYRKFHIVTLTQELYHSIQNFVWVEGG